MDDEIPSEDVRIKESTKNFEDGATSENITIKKSNYKLLVVGAIVSIAASTFFGGYFLGTLENSDSYVTAEQLKAILNTAPTDVASVIMVSIDDDPVKGNPNAPVTVIEYSDFQCPFCSRFFTQTLPQLEENYIDTGKIKFVYKDLPLDNLHPNARPAHIASECADEQGKFWEYHDVLFEKQSEWQSLPSSDLQSTLSQYASDLGLQAVSFESCMQSQDIADEVNKDTLDAARYGATGTPTFFIGNEKDGFIKLVGAQPYAVFQAEIDKQLG